jgi:hypothetical protein
MKLDIATIRAGARPAGAVEAQFERRLGWDGR